MTPAFDELLANKNFVHLTHSDYWCDWFYDAHNDVLHVFNARQHKEPSNYNIEKTFFEQDYAVMQISSKTFQLRFSNSYDNVHLQCIKLFLKATLDINIKISHPDNSRCIEMTLENDADVAFFLLKYGAIIR